MDRSLEPWLEELRRRMLDIARRRVPADDAEDLVQSALRIVFESGAGAEPGGLIDGAPRIAWCLQVLRNVIGNHYRRAEVRRRMEVAGADPELLGRPFESLDAEARVRTIEEALAELADMDADCGRYLRRMADQMPARELAASEGLEAHALYQRLYRCRRKLRAILKGKGVLP